MLHVLLACGLIASAATGVQPPAATVTLPPAAATLGEALASIQAQSGLTLTTTLDPKLPLTLKRREGPLWPLLTEVAESAGARLSVAQKGKAVAIVPGVESVDMDYFHKTRLSSIDGAFRVVAKQVVCRRDIDTGKRVTEVTLEVHYPPRLPVFRIDSEPRGTVSGVVVDDSRALRRLLKVFTNDMTPSASKTAVAGSAFTSLLRFPELPLSKRMLGTDGRINSLDIQGKFAVTAAAKMLQFRVADTTKPTTLTEEGVTFTLQTPRKVGDRWDVPVELVYPPSKVEFESFEAGVWLSQNRLQLIDPAGKPLDPINEDFRESPGKANLVYRFPAGKVPADRAGWSLVYETPSPLVEFDVAFTLSNIPLP